MPSINVSAEVHERLRIRAHRTGRTMSSVADRLLAEALDGPKDEAQDESAAALALISAVARKQGSAAGFQALLLNAGATRLPARSTA